METLGGKCAPGAQILPTIFTKETMRIILNHSQVVPGGDFHNRGHLTADPGIMHRDDDPCSWRDQAFQLGFIQIQRVRTNVTEDWSGPAQGKGIRCTHKGERGHDHLITLV